MEPNDIDRTISQLLAARVHGAMTESKKLELVKHAGLRGKFREILVSTLIQQLLPHTCRALHGTVIDSAGRRSSGDINCHAPRKTEDDILIADTECLPPLLFSKSEAILPLESVLARIEVKSTLRRDELKDAISGADCFSKLTLSLPHGSPDAKEAKTIQAIFAFSSDLKSPSTNDFKRMIEVFHELNIDISAPPIECLCIVGRGLWTFNSPGWGYCKATEDYLEVLTFAAKLLDRLPALRLMRKGASLGSYIPCLKEAMVPLDLP